MNTNTENALAVIDFTPTKVFLENYEELKQAAQEYLEKYQNLIISEEDNKSGKELFVEINAKYKALDSARKEFVKNASAPIKEADARIKELLSLYDEVKAAIRKQTDAHDESRKEIARTLLTELLESTWASLGVEDEFRNATIDDLVILGSLTEKNRLTAKAKRAVETKAQEDKNLQTTVEFRLKDLEAQSYKAGLSVPLSKTNVQYFLLSDEETYQEKLAELIGSEVERERQANAAREKAEQERLAAEEANRKAAEQKAEQERIAAVKQAEEEAERKRQFELSEMQKKHQEEQLALEQELRNELNNEFNVVPDGFDDSDFPVGNVDQSDYEMLDIENTSVIGVGSAGAVTTIKLSFSVQEHSTASDVESEVMKALSAGGLGDFIRDIKVELLPF